MALFAIHFIDGRQHGEMFVKAASMAEAKDRCRRVMGDHIEFVGVALVQTVADLFAPFGVY